MAHARERLAGPKRPGRVAAMAELPRGEAGKLLRRIIREQQRRGG